MLALLFFACSPPSGPGEILLLPGEDGPYGAAWVQTRAQARVSETVSVEVTFPADADGQPDPAALPAPAVVLVQGGLVEAERYRWLAAHTAAQGYVVIAPDHPNDLAFFAAQNGRAALEAVERGGGVLDGLVTPGGPAATMGHSLGGVVASILWAQDDRFDGLITLASYPADGTDVESRDTPHLALTGALDASALVEQVEAGWERFAGPRWLGVVEGMGHYGWTDGDSPEDLAGGGDLDEGAIDDAEARAAAMPPLDAYLELVLRGDASAADTLDAGAFEGVSWSL